MRPQVYTKLRSTSCRDGEQRHARFRGHLCRGLFLMTIICIMFKTAEAQNYLTQTGSPSFTTSQPVELGFVNVANGNRQASQVATPSRQTQADFICEIGRAHV